MKLATAIVSLAIAAFASVPGAVADSDVQNVILEKYMDFVTSSDKGVYIEFYAPWCGYCRRLIPLWEQTATELKKRGIPVGKIDATMDKDLANTFKVQRYPSIWFIKGGKAFEHRPPKRERSLDDFIDFAENDAAREKDAFEVREAPSMPQTDVVFAGIDAIEEVTNNAEIDAEIAEFEARAGEKGAVADLDGNGERLVLFMGVTGRADTDMAMPLFKKISADYEDSVRVLYADLKEADRDVSTRFYIGRPMLDTRAGLVSGGKVYWFDPTLKEKDVLRDIRKGRTDNAVDIPAPRPAYELYLEKFDNAKAMLLADARTMYKFKKGILAAVAGSFFVLGFIFAQILRCLCSSAPSKGKKNKKE